MIKTIKLNQIKLTLKRPFTTSFMTEYDADRIIVTIQDENGNTGIGEVATLNIPVYKPGSDILTNFVLLDKYIIPSIQKFQQKTPIDTIDQLLESYKWIEGGLFSKSGIEMAFWHLLSKQQQKSIIQLFQGNNLNIECGDSVGAKTSKEALKRVDQAIKLGFKRIKVKIWPDHDIDVIASIRKKYPKVPLQVDANSAYTPNDWKILNKLDEFNLEMIEQPLANDDIIQHAFLSKKIETPICLDESILSNQHAQSAIKLWSQLGLKNKLIINIKPPRVGGYFESIQIAKTCRKFYIPAWCGGMLETNWDKYFNLCLNSRGEFTLPGDHHSSTGGYSKKDFSAETFSSDKGIHRIGNPPHIDLSVLDQLTVKQKIYKFKEEK